MNFINNMKYLYGDINVESSDVTIDTNYGKDDILRFTITTFNNTNSSLYIKNIKAVIKSVNDVEKEFIVQQYESEAVDKNVTKKRYEQLSSLNVESRKSLKTNPLAIVVPKGFSRDIKCISLQYMNQRSKLKTVTLNIKPNQNSI